MSSRAVSPESSTEPHDRRHHPQPGLPPAPPYAATLTLCDQGVILGEGTVIASLGDDGLDVSGREERIFALLSLARRNPAPLGVLGKFYAASRALARGEIPLAAIHLAHAGQPPLARGSCATAIAMAARKIDAALHPFTLLKSLGLLPKGLSRRTWSEVAKFNPNHVPAGNPNGGQFCSDGDGGGTDSPAKPQAKTSPKDMQAKIADALKGQKAVAFVGGAGDATSGIVQGVEQDFHKNNPDIESKYFSWTDADKLKDWIAQQNAATDGQVAVVGHSYGGDTAAQVVANGSNVSLLVTVDPVGHSFDQPPASSSTSHLQAMPVNPTYDDIGDNADTWIDINATGSEHSDTDGFLANTVAGLGQSWDDLPKGHATDYYEVPIDHNQFNQVIPSGRL